MAGDYFGYTIGHNTRDFDAIVRYHSVGRIARISREIDDKHSLANKGIFAMEFGQFGCFTGEHRADEKTEITDTMIAG